MTARHRHERPCASNRCWPAPLARLALVALLAGVAAPGGAAAQTCELLTLCPDRDPMLLCNAQFACEGPLFECIQGCSLVPPPQAEACVEDCKTAFVSCGTAQYAAGAACYPCLFDPALCDDMPPRCPTALTPLESWSATPLASYVPTEAGTFFAGDAGVWVVNDTISNSENCGATPHRATVSAVGLDRELTLTSIATQTGCSDNVWIELITCLPEVGNEFHIPLDAGTRISFCERGQLVDPAVGSSSCLLPPCGDTVSLRLADNRGNTLAYLLQRAPTRQPRTDLPIYREILLDPAGGSFARDLLSDFSTIPEFDPNGAHLRIESVTFEVDEVGSAMLDDLCIGPGCAAPAACPEPVAGTGLAVACAALLLLAHRNRPGTRI